MYEVGKLCWNLTTKLVITKDKTSQRCEVTYSLRDLPIEVVTTIGKTSEQIVVQKRARLDVLIARPNA